MVDPNNGKKFKSISAKNETELGREVVGLRTKVENVLSLVTEYGWIDGSHHKQWVLDQIVKELLSNIEYTEWAGSDWDVGIAP